MSFCENFIKFLPIVCEECKNKTYSSFQVIQSSKDDENKENTDLNSSSSGIYIII